MQVTQSLSPKFDKVLHFIPDQGLEITIQYFTELEHPFVINADSQRQVATLYDGSQLEVVQNNGKYYYFSVDDNQYVELDAEISKVRANLPIITLSIQDYQFASTFDGTITANFVEVKSAGLVNIYDLFAAMKQEIKQLNQEGSQLAITNRGLKCFTIQYRDKIAFKNKEKIITIDMELKKRTITLEEQLISSNQYFFKQILKLQQEIVQLKTTQISQATPILVNCSDFENHQNCFMTKVYTEPKVRFQFQLNENEIDFKIGIVAEGDLTLTKTKKSMFFEIPTGNFLRGDPELGIVKIINHLFNINDEIWIEIDIKKHSFSIYINELKISTIKMLNVIVSYSFVFHSENQDLSLLDFIGNVVQEQE